MALAEALEGTVSLDERVLRQVVGDIGVAANPQQERVDLAPVRLVEQAEGRLSRCTGERDDMCVARHRREPTESLARRSILIE